MFYGPEAQGHGQVGLAHAGRTQEQNVGGFSYEGQVGQLLDLPFVYGGLEAKVELLQGALEGQVGQLGPGGEVALPAGGHFRPQQLSQHLRIGQLLVGGSVEGVVQGFHCLLEAEGLQVLAGLLQGHHLAPPAAARS